MRNLLMFHGSCGHTTVREVSDEAWTSFASVRIDGALVNRFRVGSKTRMVYVYPMRFTFCYDCVKGVNV